MLLSFNRYFQSRRACPQIGGGLDRAARGVLDRDRVCSFIAPMDVKKLSLPGLIQLTPRLFSDARGYFIETYNETAKPFV